VVHEAQANAVESSNIVGYTTQDKTGSQYVSLGACFMNTGDASTFKLSDIELNGGDCTQDNIQVLESTKAAVTEKYVYVSAAQALEFGDASFQGWWNFTMDTSMDDVEFEIGAAFLGNFATK
jgi:hypothetical protein